jgi:hypothetical protein
VPRSIRVGSWSRDTSIEELYAGVLGRARPHSMRIEGAKASLDGIPRLAALVGLEHELWGALELVSSRSGSNAHDRSSLTLSIWGACSDPSQARL